MSDFFLDKKIIYKSKKLVNWDTVLKTAISDLEVDQREVNSKLYHIKYPIDGTEDFITITTTRPETMLGDTAVAVNPKDKRYKRMVGKNVTLPLVGRKIKIITDEYSGRILVDPTLAEEEMEKMKSIFS